MPLIPSTQVIAAEAVWAELGRCTNSAASNWRASVKLERYLIPTSGSKTYSVRAHRAVADGLVAAGVGGLGVDMPGFIRISKVLT